MSEFGPRSLNPRKFGALGMLVVSGFGWSPNTYHASLASPAEQTARPTLVNEDLQPLAAYSPEAQPPKIVLEHVGDFNIANGHHGLGSVLKQKGLNLTNSPFSLGRIKKEVATAVAIGHEAPEMPLTLGTFTSKDTITLPIKLGLDPEEFHGFIVAKDPKTVQELTGVYIPAITPIEVGSKSKSKGRVSYLSPAIGFRPAFKAKINFNTYDLATETCNNVLEPRLTEEGQKTLNQLLGQSNQDTATKLVMIKISHEAACASYALASSTAQAGMTYEQYKTIAEKQHLQRALALNLRVPYIVFQKALWHRVSEFAKAG